MSLNQKNPTLTDSWKKLKQHFNQISKQKIVDHFKINENRGREFSTNFNEIHFDYSKNKINSETINLFKELLTEIDFSDSVKSCFKGDKINETEFRSVLHTALRAKGTEEIKVGLSVQVPQSLKDDFETICKENNVSMSSMLLSLIQVAVEEVQEKENYIFEINKELNRLISDKNMLLKIQSQSDEDVYEQKDGSVIFISQELESYSTEIAALEEQLLHLMTLKGGLENS